MEQYIEKIKANQITEIDLSINDCDEIDLNDLITDVEIVTLAKALKYNSSLTSLNLVGNKIGVKGAQVFSEALKVNSSLTTLNLGCNQLTNPDLQVLSEMLKKNTSLNSLYIDNNLIDSIGIQAFYWQPNRS